MNNEQSITQNVILIPCPDKNVHWSRRKLERTWLFFNLYKTNTYIIFITSVARHHLQLFRCMFLNLNWNINVYLSPIAALILHKVYYQISKQCSKTRTEKWLTIQCVVKVLIIYMLFVIMNQHITTCPFFV